MKKFTLFTRLLPVLLLACALLAAPQDIRAQGPDPVVKLETSMGDILVRLDARKAPMTTANFLEYVKAGQYDGTIFHRVIKDFMIQGGGMTASLREKTTRAPIKNEADNGLRNRKYTIAMARTSDPHSATAQFFINVKDNSFLDHRSKDPQGWGYAVFGKVIRGQDVVDQIAAVKTGSRGYYEDVPMQPVIIKRATIVETFSGKRFSLPLLPLPSKTFCSGRYRKSPSLAGGRGYRETGRPLFFRPTYQRT